MQHPVDGKFTRYQVAGYARKVEHQRLDMELAMLGTHQLFFDVRKIAVMHIDIAVVYVKPCATVENTATPSADLGDLTLPTDLTQMLGLEIAAVVDRQIPVAIWTMCSLGTRAAQRYRLDSGQGGQNVGDGIEKTESDVVIGPRRRRGLRPQR